MKAFLEVTGWALMALAMVGVLHLFATMESTALKQQDMHHEHSHDR
jgi:hypothetical protein